MQTGHISNQRRTPLDVKGLALIALSFQTLGIYPPIVLLILCLTSFAVPGIIYSDIGTSPLYVLNGIWPANGPAPSEEDVIGGISAIIWSLTILPLIKYVGHSITLYRPFVSQLSRSSLPLDLEPMKVRTVYIAHVGMADSVCRRGRYIRLVSRFIPSRRQRFRRGQNADRRQLQARPILHLQALLSPALAVTLMCTLRTAIPLISPAKVSRYQALFGTSLTLADGIFTPAVSVTSAVAGIAVAKPSVSSDITPISIVSSLAQCLPHVLMYIS